MLLFVATTAAIASPFAPHRPDEGYGIGTSTWRFSSSLSKDASGLIEFCYEETGASERVLGRLDVRPFVSSRTEMPDLRILFSKAEVDGAPRVIVIAAYGLRSGVFVADVPSLSSHSLTIAGTPHPNESGEITLLGFGEGRVGLKPDGMTGVRGRLFFRYVPKG